MSLSANYAFAVVVTALDGRSDSQKVLVSPAYNGSVQVSITTSYVTFNPGAKLIVSAAAIVVSSNYKLLSAFL